MCPPAVMPDLELYIASTTEESFDLSSVPDSILDSEQHVDDLSSPNRQGQALFTNQHSQVDNVINGIRCFTHTHRQTDSHTQTHTDRQTDRQIIS